MIARLLRLLAIRRLNREIEARMAARKLGRVQRQAAARKGWQTRRRV